MATKYWLTGTREIEKGGRIEEMVNHRYGRSHETYRIQRPGRPDETVTVEMNAGTARTMGNNNTWDGQGRKLWVIGWVVVSALRLNCNRSQSDNRSGRKRWKSWWPVKCLVLGLHWFHRGDDRCEDCGCGGLYMRHWQRPTPGKPGRQEQH